jgi:hypothetical protein
MNRYELLEEIGKIKNISGVKNVTVQANGSTRLVIESEAKEELLAEISKVIVEQNAGLIRMSPVQHALEDYYLRLISGGRPS